MRLIDRVSSHASSKNLLRGVNVHASASVSNEYTSPSNQAVASKLDVFRTPDLAARLSLSPCRRADVVEGRRAAARTTI